jgi:hypothetical protein
LESGQRVSIPPPQRAPGAVRRVLLLAGEAVATDTVLREIKMLAGGSRAEVFVVSPALTSSPLKHVAGEVDDAIEAARLRLDTSVRALRAEGLSASGEVGDSDPSLALEDALRRFPADEVVIVTHPKGKSSWLEWDAIEKAGRELAVPVTHVVVDVEKGNHVKEIEHVPPTLEEEPPTATAYDLPRLTARGWSSIVVGVVGTIVLGILAVLCAGDISGQGMSTGCAIRIGLAIAAFIVTVFHVLALMVFGFVRYRGRAERLAADTLLYGIPPAIVISLIAGG